MGAEQILFFARRPSFPKRNTQENPIMNKLKSFNISNIYYLAVMLAYTLTMFFYVQPGVFAAILMLCITAQLLLQKKINLNTTVDYLIVAYLAYNLLSVIWLTANGLPIGIYVEEFSNSVLPVIFYFVGKSIQEGTEKFYRWFLTAILYVCLLGLILYIWAPEFYLRFLYDVYISKADAATMRIRMASVIGSTCLGALATYGMLASAYFIVKDKTKRVIGIILFFVNFFFAMMSNQRAAMVVAFIIILYTNWLIFFTFGSIKKKYLGVEIGALIAAVIGICIIDIEAILKIVRRLVSLPGAVGQRSEQWVVAMETLYNIWLGNGLGANGHKALELEGAHVIADGGLVKLFCEEGVIGFSIFLFILFLVCKSAVKNIRDYYVELGIIMVTLLSSIGSNIIAFQLTAPIFWFAVGRCASSIMKQTTTGDTEV